MQMVIYPGIIDISYCNNVSTGWVSKEEFEQIVAAHPTIVNYPTENGVKLAAGWLIEQAD